jgi:outer membrane protein TolC
MMRTIFPLFVLLLFANQIVAQESIPVGLEKLSNITLTESPLVKQNILTITTAEGSLQIQTSTFDYQLTSGLALSRDRLNLLDADFRGQFIDNNLLKSAGTNASLGLQKAFRSSLIAELTVDYAMARDNFPLDIFQQNIGADMEDHRMTTTFSLTQPLLRGKGRTIATALEEASKLDLESSDNNATFANSFELFQMSSAYWEYLGAYKSLEIFRGNEARVRRVLEVTEELVKADKRPAGDLAQIKADLANQERQTRVAEQLLYNTKLELGRVIGLSEENSKQLGNPLDQFPEVEQSGYTKDINKARILEIAQENRADIEAAKKRQESLELQLKFNENTRRPQLDLTGFVNYGGTNMGNGLDRALAVFTNREGRNIGYGARLTFSFPVNNNLATGNVVQSQAALQTQELVTTNLQRNIDLNVSTAVNNLEKSIEILEKAKEALKFSREVFENEQEKFRNGMTILLNLIQFQDRLTLAELDYLRAQQQFATAIASLRFETGTLLVNTNKGSDINKQLFYTIPN